MKKFSNTLSRTIAMMMDPPTGSPRASDITLATRRMMTSGLIRKRRRLIRAAKRDSLTMLFGPY
jgi:hypothetical protein